MTLLEQVTAAARIRGPSLDAEERVLRSYPTPCSLSRWHFRCDAIDLANLAIERGDEEEKAAWLKVSLLDDDTVNTLISLGVFEHGGNALEILSFAATLPARVKSERAPKRSRGLGQKTLSLRKHIEVVFAAFEGVMSARQVFYQLVSRGAVQNTPAAYERASRAVVDMRRDGSIPYDRVVDRTRRVHKLAGWAGVRSAMQALASQYRRDPWDEQPTHVHVAVEKQALEGVFSEVVDTYGAPLFVTRGFASESFVYEWSVEIRRARDAGHRVHVAYFGDCDPDGFAIETDIRKRLDRLDANPDSWERGGLLFSDLEDFELINVPVKRAGSRARRYLDEYGDRAAELDALPPRTLHDRILSSITSRVDIRAWDSIRAIELAETESLNLVAGRFEEALAAARSAA